MCEENKKETSLPIKLCLFRMHNMLAMKIDLERQMSLLFCSKKSSTIQCGGNDTVAIKFQKNYKNVYKSVQMLCSLLELEQTATVQVVPEAWQVKNDIVHPTEVLTMDICSNKSLNILYRRHSPGALTNTKSHRRWFMTEKKGSAFSGRDGQHKLCVEVTVWFHVLSTAHCRKLGNNSPVTLVQFSLH